MKPLSTTLESSTGLVSLVTSTVIIINQIVWNKVINSKTLALFILALTLFCGVIFWNQASTYYQSLTTSIFHNQRVARENKQLLERKLYLWQAVTEVQPNSEVLNSEFDSLLPLPQPANP